MWRAVALSLAVAIGEDTEGPTLGAGDTVIVAHTLR